MIVTGLVLDESRTEQIQKYNKPVIEENKGRTTVSGHHLEVTDALRVHAEEKISHLPLGGPPLHSDIILEMDGKVPIARLSVTDEHGVAFHASTEDENLYHGIDETVAKIARQIRKHKAHLLKKRHKPLDL